MAGDAVFNPATAGRDAVDVAIDASGEACVGIDHSDHAVASLTGNFGCATGAGTGVASIAWGDGSVSRVALEINAVKMGLDLAGTVTDGPFEAGTLTGHVAATVAHDDDGHTGCGIDDAVTTPSRTFLLVMPPIRSEAGVTPTYVALFTEVDMDPAQSLTYDELMRLAQDHASTRLSDVGNLAASPTDVVTGETPEDTIGALAPSGGVGENYDRATERGYLLRNPGYVRQERHLYESDPLYATHWACWSTCAIDSRVKVWFRYYINGGDSRLWKIRFRAQQIYGTRGYRTWYEYYCAVNIKDATDRYCPYFKSDGADDSDISSFYDGDYAWYHFGNYYKVTKFPMVNIHLMWSSSQEARYPGSDKPGARFRGWDVCVTASSTRICPSSGSGR